MPALYPNMFDADSLREPVHPHVDDADFEQLDLIQDVPLFFVMKH